MQPTWRLTDQDADYTPSVKTNVQETWKRFGWVPTTEEERQDRQRKASNEDRENQRSAA